MRIKKILKSSLIVFLPFFLLIYFIFCLNLIIKDFTFGHKSHNFNPAPINWLAYKIDYYKFNFFNFFINRNLDQGLERVDIFIPEKTSKKLLSDAPSSTKKYLPSKMVINKKIFDTSIRYLGDNPVNYMFDKKSLRVKTRKDELVNRQRYYEYKFTQSNPLHSFVAFKLAAKMDNLVSRVKLVELFINKKSKGIFLQKERLNESFLRRNKIMPVNMYKGEQSNNMENKLGLSDDLTKNSGIWEKISNFNIYELENKNDLKLFLKNLKNSENNSEYLNKILDNGNKEILAKKIVLETLLQALINNDTHNQRIVVDSWSGKIYHIPHDFNYSLEESNLENILLDNSSSSLNRSLNQSSLFQDTKFKLLFKYVNDEKIFRQIIDDLKKIKNSYLISEKRDHGFFQRKFYKGGLTTEKQNNENFEQIFESLKMREEKILQAFYQKPNASWETNKNGFIIKVDQTLPLSKFTINFKNYNPKWIALDYNNNSILDNEDVYFKKKNDGSFYLDINLFSNRIQTMNLSRMPAAYNTKLVNTQFKFFVENNISPHEIYTYNHFINKKFKLDKIKNKSFKPTLNNIAILNNAIKKTKIFSGSIDINENLVVNEISKIDPGTVFNLSEGKSIIFKNKIIANGTLQKPIIFQSKKKNKIWGTIAIHGKKTNNSLLNNILIQGGSGDVIDGINYFASLSVHSGENIKFQNVQIKNNAIYDDMVHLIYSADLYFNNIDLKNAYKDAIDIDVSSNININNLNISNSGNDGVDLMESNVSINNCFITHSKDKGISVGEGSVLKIKNCEVRESNYGIASKDASIVYVDQSLLDNNKIQLSTYKKNWRYNSSGKIFFKNSRLSSKFTNKLIGDEYGEIRIFSSTVNGELANQGNVKIN